jgi:hypothetical protein
MTTDMGESEHLCTAGQYGLRFPDDVQWDKGRRVKFIALAKISLSPKKVLE